MAVLVFQHAEEDPPAQAGVFLRDEGHALRILRMDQQDAVPPDYDNVHAVLTLGGPMQMEQTQAHGWLEPEMTFIKGAHDRGLPVLGIGLGAQLVAAALGGTVEPMDEPEVGFRPVDLTTAGWAEPVLSGVPWHTTQFHLHEHTITELPEEATALAQSEKTPNQAFRVGLTTYGFQFHFEWTKQHLQALEGRNALVQAGLTRDKLEAELEQNYEPYRRVGDRIAQRLAMLVFPVDKRLGV